MLPGATSKAPAIQTRDGTRLTNRFWVQRGGQELRASVTATQMIKPSSLTCRMATRRFICGQHFPTSRCLIQGGSNFALITTMVSSHIWTGRNLSESMPQENRESDHPITV